MSQEPSQEPLLPYHGNINYVPRPPDSQHSSQLIDDNNNTDKTTNQQFIDFTKQANQLLDEQAHQLLDHGEHSQSLDFPSQLSLDPDFLPPIAESSSVKVPIRYDSQSQVLESLDPYTHTEHSQNSTPPTPLSLSLQRPAVPVSSPDLIPSVAWDSPTLQRAFPFHPGVFDHKQELPVQKQSPNLLRVAPSVMKPLVPKRDEMRNKRQCTSTGKAMYESSELYSVNPTPSLEVLRTMKSGVITQLRDTNNRVYYKADEHEFNAEWVNNKMSQLTINNKTDSLWWVRADSHESKGMFMQPWPSVGSIVTLDDDGNNQHYTVLENSDGQIERKARARNTGYVILRKV